MLGLSCERHISNYITAFGELGLRIQEIKISILIAPDLKTIRLEKLSKQEFQILNTSNMYTDISSL
ncbi:13225_t:CDS:2 [Dentiscutata heterogama]|uniref:13225_t:CDS:1 n=1 Tax=Dentiscutata heterogama TaxID=1316150 RepID=A0ACA9K148_9GLOM|nr:13225_t:CDS:2 [Dentiscutata heterogama]